MPPKTAVPTESAKELLASLARTADVTTDPQDNTGHQGVLIVVDVTAIAATPSVVPTIRFRDPITSKQVTLLAGAALTAVGVTAYLIAPDAVAGGGITAAVAMLLPKDWDLFMNHADADSITYQVSRTYMG